jgi:hypothetical protein
MKVLSWNDDMPGLEDPMTHQPPGRFFRPTTLSVVVMALGVSILISSRYAEWNKWRAAALLYQEVGWSLEADRQSLLNQSAIKRATIEELSAGRITLQEATTRFLVLDADWPRIQAHVDSTFPGISDSEREARCVVLLVCNHTLEPVARRLLIERLAAEFKMLFPTAVGMPLLMHKDGVSLVGAG